METYAKQNGFTNLRWYTDDGFSGANFQRPGFQAMLADIEARKVGTVIVKDQSRIGRDVVEVGLLKRTFDEYHVRFIAANDNLDTANGFDIMSIFRDVINYNVNFPRCDKRVVCCRRQPENQDRFQVENGKGLALLRQRQLWLKEQGSLLIVPQPCYLCSVV